MPTLIGGDAADDFAGAGRPRDVDAVCGRARPQAEVQAQVVLRAEAAAAADLVDESPPTGLDHDPGADRAAVGAGPFELDNQGVAVRGRTVVEQAGGVVHVVHDHVEAPTIE